MNRNATQFWVAIIGMVALSSITGFTVVLGLDGKDMLVGGLVSAVSLSVAWLFRLNGSGK